MGKVALVADFDTVIGFKLAGLKDAYTAENGVQALNIIKNLVKSVNYDIIVVTESLATSIRRYMKEERDKMMPIIVEIPDKTGPSPTIEFIRELVKKTVGVEVIIG
ncbi:MAG: V-type ATP synthase subunit F [Candidatus Methanomethylicia archaeon]|nr:V-type ATP synthase subunit F [Candidatus Methanomethylicia archaeon]MCX8169117.1 V-type ATP synthase subunit F [Candidatus Methanomethylicia archaeon]MDW7988849.1 V-type ATP synthase subunit F [Nitrososphaerota archaeon]